MRIQGDKIMTRNKNRFDFCASASSLLALIILAAGSPAHAQKTAPPAAAPNRTQGGFMSSSSKPALEVDLSALPQMTAREIASYPEHELRPADGFSDAEYWEKKRLAREQALAGLTGAKSTHLGANYSPVGATPMLDLGANALRPPSVGAFEGFFAQQELCAGCNWPPDMAVAVGTSFVVQIVN